MTVIDNTAPPSLTLAIGAVGELWKKSFVELTSLSVTAALSARIETEAEPISSSKIISFYRNFLPLRRRMIVLLADNYRRYFKLALAHPRQSGSDPDRWASNELAPATGAALEWIRDWYILACDGENQYVRPIASAEFVPGQTISIPIHSVTSASYHPESWRAPVWLFQVSLALHGIGLVKQKNMPTPDSLQRLGGSHTRLLLKGARRVFLWDLKRDIETVRNEEIAAAGAIRLDAVNVSPTRLNKRKGSEVKLKLYVAIRKILSQNPSLMGMKFCAELDKRHAPPLFDWVKSGEWADDLTWKEAWGDHILRRKIRRVRQEAMKTGSGAV